MTDITARRIRRHLETIQLPVPHPAVMEEIVRFIEDSNTYYSVRRHLEIVDEAVTEALDGDVAKLEDYDAGYRAALEDIQDLQDLDGNTAAENNNGPSAA